MQIRIHRAVAAALCALSLLTPAARAQQDAVAPVKPAASAEKIDARAKAIHDKAVAAAKAMTAFECVAETKLEGEMDGVALPDFGGKRRVAVRFAAKPAAPAKPDAAKRPEAPALPPHSMRIERVDGDAKGSYIILHAGRALRVDPAKKTYSEIGEGDFMAISMELATFPNWFDQARGASDGVTMGEPDMLAMKGTATIDDLECDIIEVSREGEVSVGVVEEPGADAEAAAEMRTMKMRITETLAVARADGLPRRMTLSIDAGEAGGGPMTIVPVTTVTALKVDPKLDDAMFAVKAPDGFTKVEPEAPEEMFQATGLAEADAAPEAPALAVKVGDAAPDFALVGLDGKEVTLASLKGKVVLLDFWATWCGPCKAAMPTIQKLHDEYKARPDGKDVVILGVNTWEEKKDAAKDYMAGKKFTYGCLLKGDDLAAKLGIRGIPTLVVIGKDGRIALIEVGLADATGGSLRKAIDAETRR